jgi:hypothetical protein
MTWHKAFYFSVRLCRLFCVSTTASYITDRWTLVRDWIWCDLSRNEFWMWASEETEMGTPINRSQRNTLLIGWCIARRGCREGHGLISETKFCKQWHTHVHWSVLRHQAPDWAHSKLWRQSSRAPRRDAPPPSHHTFRRSNSQKMKQSETLGGPMRAWTHMVVFGVKLQQNVHSTLSSFESTLLACILGFRGIWLFM